MHIRWQHYALQELDAISLYQVFRLRQDVFVLEQNCLYPDIDAMDEQATHLLGFDTEQHLVAYLRILPPGAHYTEPAIGRVVVTPSQRGQGIGGLLISEGVRLTHLLHSKFNIRLSAQSHLIALYEDAGFVCVGEGYMEDGIPHQEMLLSGP